MLIVFVLSFALVFFAYISIIYDPSTSGVHLTTMWLVISRSFLLRLCLYYVLGIRVNYFIGDSSDFNIVLRPRTQQEYKALTFERT